MIEKVVLYQYSCSCCGYLWKSEENIINPICPKCSNTTTPFQYITNSPCDSCMSNPKNGGSGICFCTLGNNISF